MWAHAFAPGARILLEETPLSETEGVHELPQIVRAENYVVNHNLGDVITQSFGATEQTFPSQAALLDLRCAFINAKSDHVAVLGVRPNAGATGYEYNGKMSLKHRVNSSPSSDPLVTSIGETMLKLDSRGARLSPDVDWNEGFGVGSGDVSSVFTVRGTSRPSGAWSPDATAPYARKTRLDPLTLLLAPEPGRVERCAGT